MSYLHIENLYRPEAQVLLLFRRVWALEKVHGTSVHISWRSWVEKGEPANGAVLFFSGGASHDRFVKLFDGEKLKAGFVAVGYPRVTVYGEAYGGRQQGMSATYGKELRFIAFDVSVLDDSDEEVWLSVPDAVQVVEALGLEFVPYEEVATDLALLDVIRDRPSEVAQRRGCGDDKPREGIVLRPLVEMQTNFGRVIAKYKGAAFEERATPQTVVDPAKIKVLAEAEAIAQEWCTPMRLSHVLDKLKVEGVDVSDVPATRLVIPAMIEDVKREAAGEVVWSKDAERAVGKRAAQLFKARVTKIGGAE